MCVFVCVCVIVVVVVNRLEIRMCIELSRVASIGEYFKPCAETQTHTDDAARIYRIRAIKCNVCEMVKEIAIIFNWIGLIWRARVFLVLAVYT